MKRAKFGRFDTAEDRGEIGFAHELQELGMLGDVERRFAAERERIAVTLLPIDEDFDEFSGGPAIADEVVIDEIDGAVCAGRQHGIELFGNVLGSLQARIAAIESRDVAKLALIGTAARKLDVGEEIFFELAEVIGGDGEIIERCPLDSVQTLLPSGPLEAFVYCRDDAGRRIAKFSHMQIVE